MLRTITLASLTALALGLAALGGATDAAAKPKWKHGHHGYHGYHRGPPPWAPAHGWRRKHRGHYGYGPAYGIREGYYGRGYGRYY
jgi:hypothetical protein